MELQGAQLKVAQVGLEAVEALLPAYNGDAQFNVWSGLRPVLTLDEVRADMQTTLARPGGTVWRITDGAGELVGIAGTALVPPPETAWIALLLIRRDWQRRGYGSEAVSMISENWPQVSCPYSGPNGSHRRFLEEGSGARNTQGRGSARQGCSGRANETRSWHFGGADPYQAGALAPF